MKAEFVKELTGFTGMAKLYKLSEPVKYEKGQTKYIVISATYAMFSGNETYIFPADENGKIVNWGELDGSYRGGLSHAKALRNFLKSYEK